MPQETNLNTALDALKSPLRSVTLRLGLTVPSLAPSATLTHKIQSLPLAIGSDPFYGV
jgi:hypothetical protein